MSRTRTLPVGVLMLCVAAAGLAGCGTCRPREAACMHATSIDREAERRAVLAAVLESVRQRGQERFVVSPVMGSAGLLVSWDEGTVKTDFFKGMPTLRTSDGTFVVVPEIRGLLPATMADWAAHARQIPVPRDLRLSLPVVWFPDEEWKDWEDFHRRFGQDAEWLHVSDVGFSPRGAQALVFVASTSDYEAGAGHWLLLRREAGGWAVVEDLMDWVS